MRTAASHWFNLIRFFPSHTTHSKKSPAADTNELVIYDFPQEGIVPHFSVAVKRNGKIENYLSIYPKTKDNILADDPNPEENAKTPFWIGEIHLGTPQELASGRPYEETSIPISQSERKKCLSILSDVIENAEAGRIRYSFAGSTFGMWNCIEGVQATLNVLKKPQWHGVEHFFMVPQGVRERVAEIAAERANNDTAPIPKAM